ncbi:MAG: NTF2 fold immunity protein [Hyphomicrobiaceae bacterium]
MPEFEGKDYDLSVYLYLISGERLITKSTALEISRMVLCDRFGSEEVRRQEPFGVEERGETWVVSGGQQPQWDDGRPREALRLGRAEVIISQLDGRIIKLAVEAPIPPLDD